MGKILYYDCFSGISGDMNLGAMVDLGIDGRYLLDELKKLHLEGYRLEIKKDLKMGISGTKVRVILDDVHTHDHHPNHHHSHHHDNHHDHHHHDHVHPHKHEQKDVPHSGHQHEEGKHEHKHAHHHHDEHRNLNDIREIVENSSLDKAVKERAMKMFLIIGEAEAKIHNKRLDEIHFHEVGAVDSIVDVVGAAICLEKLNVDKIMAGNIETGGGFVHCAHGVFPVPAPATMEILKNIPIKKGAVDSETTTPTGAAILAANVHEFNAKAELKILKTAYGIGHKDFSIPNVLRVHLAETVNESKSDYEIDTQTMTECNLDDMNPELQENIMQQLFKKGALDVFYTPVMMKKSRPGIVLSVLHKQTDATAIKDLLLEQTSTLGVRSYQVDKTMLRRKFEALDSTYGTVNIKLALKNDKILKAKPEYADCEKIASEKNIPIQKIYKDIENLIYQKYFKEK